MSDNVDKMDRLTESCVRTEAIVETLARASLDHESRLRWLERLMSYGTAGTMLTYFLFNAYFGI